MKPAIHQLVAGFSNGDAISNEALVLRNSFRSWGFVSDIYCESKRILPELRKTAKDISLLRPNCDDVVLLHLSIGSLANDVFASLNCRKAIIYHNMTPPFFFKSINDRISFQLEKGLSQAKSLAGAADLTIAVSQFNANELISMGYKNVKVLPIILDLEVLNSEYDKNIVKKYKDGLVNVLFVGRFVPNKAIEDIVTAFAYYKNYIQPRSRLIHVGSYSGSERYYHLVKKMALDMGVGDAVFAGAVDQKALNAYYKIASVFLCMSEHEGFCIPIIESMKVGLPVIAYSAGAVPETMDGAGVIFKEKNFPMIAEMIELLVNDKPFRRAVIDKQNERIKRFQNRDTISELKSLLTPLLP